METFRPIAMRCTQEQFDAVKPKLVKAGKIGLLIEAFERYDYITNNYGNEVNYFDFIDENKDIWDFKLNKIYQEWNEEILLKACGIEAENIQPMGSKEEQLIKDAKERGFLTEGNEFYSCFDDKNEIRIIKPYDSESEINLYLDEDGYLRYYDGLNNEYGCGLCSNPAIYKDGVWAEIKNNNLTLTEQLEKAEAEVKRLKEAVEDSKIKIGDWVKRTYKSIELFKADSTHDYRYINSEKSVYKKITNPELIKLLEQELISKPKLPLY